MDRLGSRCGLCSCTGSTATILPKRVKLTVPATGCSVGILTILKEWGISEGSRVSVNQEGAVRRLPLEETERDGDPALALVQGHIDHNVLNFARVSRDDHIVDRTFNISDTLALILPWRGRCIQINSRIRIDGCSHVRIFCRRLLALCLTLTRTQSNRGFKHLSSQYHPLQSLSACLVFTSPLIRTEGFSG